VHAQSTTGFVFMLNVAVSSLDEQELQPTSGSKHNGGRVYCCRCGSSGVLAAADGRPGPCMGKRPHQHRDRQPGCARAIKIPSRVRGPSTSVVNHFIRNRIIRSRVLLLPTEENVSDSLTKLVSEKKSAYCNVGMGLVRF
jgi:hypothetical protein